MKRYEDIKKDILSRITTVNTNEGSFADITISPTALEIEKNYVLLNQIYNNIFLENLSSEDLESKANEYGITRKEGTKSIGKVSIQALKDTVIPKDTLVSTSYGLNYLTIEEITFTSDATLIVDVIAEEVGTKYNVSAGSINNLPISISGVVSVTNAVETKDGTNIETDEELLNRLLIRLRTSATSGNAMHYKMWAMEVEGIGDAKVYPLWNGNGTVQILVITTDKKAPSSELINKVISKIEEERPIGANVTVTAPTEIDINIDATIKLKLNADLQAITNSYNEDINEYISDSVFKSNIVDYNKCLSLFYNIEGVDSVLDFKINNTTSNITIGEKQIQVVGVIEIEEGDI